MNKDVKNYLQSIEVLDTNQTNQLVGGFSAVFDGLNTNLGKDKIGGINVIKCGQNTNCSGGNCISGCGGGSTGG